MLVLREFQSTHPVWDATNTRHQIILLRHISIHASRMGCDFLLDRIHEVWRKISIHASRMGCDPIGERTS